MSIPVELKSLAAAIERYRFAYLMTSTESGPPHAVQVALELQDGTLFVRHTGKRTRTNVLARPAVGLIWPPEAEDGYSLIVDGVAAVEGESVRVTPTRAVLHRSGPPATPQVPGSCGSDCVELSLPPKASTPI